MIVHWIVVSIVLLLNGPSLWAAGEECGTCHRHPVTGAHTQIACTSCHGVAHDEALAHPSSAQSRAAGCVGCHTGYEAIFDQPMTTRSHEKAFVEQSYAAVDAHFYEKNCQSCHVQDCLDCHGNAGHAIARPETEACLSCHNGYFIGWDYLGRAPREEAQRYQRGGRQQGEPYLKMLPDLHAELGMACSACHSMKSLLTGRASSKGCGDCHQIDEAVIEHRIAAHREKLECYACHSAWAAQEYGSYYLRFDDEKKRQAFRLKGDEGGEYAKSTYLKQQTPPPLGLNDRGKVSPIRPAFIALYSDLRQNGEGGENRLLSARWRAFFPHTVRGGSVLCDGCHGNRRRFLLEHEEERVYLPEEDGLPLFSFWNRQGQEMANGQFFTPERFDALSEKSPEFTRAYVEKWKRVVESVVDSSNR